MPHLRILSDNLLRTAWVLLVAGHSYDYKTDDDIIAIELRWDDSNNIIKIEDQH